MRLVFLSDGSFKGKGLLRNLLGPAYSLDRNIHALGNFLARWLAAKFLEQLLAGANLFVDRLDHVNGNADRACLIGDGPGDCLANPPRGIGRKLIAAAPLELVGTLHEADIALLDQVEELQSAVGVLLRNGHDEAEVCLRQFLLCLVGFCLATPDESEGAL